MKHKRSEEAVRFIKQKKNSLIVAGIVIVVVVLGTLSLNYLNEQKHADAQKAFGEALSAETQDAIAMNLQTVAQEYGGSVYATYSLMLSGLNFIDKGEYREALTAFDGALNSKLPNAPFLTAMLWELKALALEFDDSIDEALSSYNKALSIRNNSFKRNDILLKTALLNLKIGQNEQAKKMFEEIVADTTAEEKISRIAKNEIAAMEAYERQ